MTYHLCDECEQSFKDEWPHTARCPDCEKEYRQSMRDTGPMDEATRETKTTWSAIVDIGADQNTWVTVTATPYGLEIEGMSLIPWSQLDDARKEITR